MGTCFCGYQPVLWTVQKLFISTNLNNQRFYTKFSKSGKKKLEQKLPRNLGESAEIGRAVGTDILKRLPGC